METSCPLSNALVCHRRDALALILIKYRTLSLLPELRIAQRRSCIFEVLKYCTSVESNLTSKHVFSILLSIRKMLKFCKARYLFLYELRDSKGKKKAAFHVNLFLGFGCFALDRGIYAEWMNSIRHRTKTRSLILILTRFTSRLATFLLHCAESDAIRARCLSAPSHE